jgi:hypothetical protein
MPNMESFHSVLTARANGRGLSAAKQASAILNQMVKQNKVGGSNVKPDPDSFNNVMIAWALRLDPLGRTATGKPPKVILLRMLKWHQAGNPNVLPDLSTFNLVIFAWANSRSRLRAERASTFV